MTLAVDGFGVLVTLLLVLLWVRRPAAVPLAVVAATSLTIAGMAVLALHGTRWSFDAIYSDAGFRTEAATRFADSPSLADYGYRGLGSYYPPALPWLQGRIADLVGMPAWAAMKPVTIVVALLVPVVAFLRWRRVVPPLPAALVVAMTALATADLVKPDEWLVLAVLVPWWLEVVRGVRAPGKVALPDWVEGVVLGVLLLFHSFYFLPLGLATVAGMLLDAALRRPAPLRVRRALVVGAVGLVCSVAYWLPVVLLKVRGATLDDLQRRWSTFGFARPPLPLPTDVQGVLGLLCVLWLVVRIRRNPLALGLAVALVASYVFFVGGQLLQAYGVALLPEKADELIVSLLVGGGVLALGDLAVVLAQGRSPRAWPLPAAAVALALVVPALVGHAQHWLSGRPVVAAQHMRYPDGTFPAGGLPEPLTHQHPWGVAPGTLDPSTDRVTAGWRALTGRPLDRDTVVVTARADVLATTPAHPFTAWKSIYSHPAGRFADRVALLHRVASCATPRCAWQLLRSNDFDRVDGAILTRTPEGLRLGLTTDDFPNAWVPTPVVFAPELFRAPYFTRRDVGDVALIALRGGPVNRRPGR